MIGKEIYGSYIVYPNGIVYIIKLNREISQRVVNKYKYVTLFIDKKRKDLKVHRLVAINFIDNIDNKTFVNHIDGNKSNNDYTNLEWCTHLENIKHAMDNNLLNSKGELNPSAKLKEQDVIQIRKIYKETGRSHRKIAKEFNISKTQITRTLNDVCWK